MCHWFSLASCVFHWLAVFLGSIRTKEAEVAEDAAEVAEVAEDAAEAAKQPGSPQLFFRPVLNVSCITVTVFPQLLHLHTQ
jgi:hypothetical protein